MLGRKRGGKVGPPGSQTSMAGMQKHSRGVNYARAMCIRPQNEGAWNAGDQRAQVYAVRANKNAIPAASCGGVGKNHTIVFTARCRFPGAPRAVFEGLLRAAPGGLTVSGAPPWRLRRLSTASGPNGCPAHLTVPAAVASGAQWRAERHAGTTRLGPPLRGCASEHPATATAPRPAPEDADQTPLVAGTG